MAAHHSISRMTILAFSACVLGPIGCAPDRPPPTPGPAPAPTLDLPTVSPPYKGGPPPISGGTLLVLHDGHTAVASDPDRARISIVDLNTKTLRAQVPLQPGDEPGRIAEDGGGRAFVVLRGGGALLTLDLSTGSVTARRSVCAAPRGVAYDAVMAAVHVACAGGELLTLPAVGDQPLRTLRLDDDLRDVVVQGDSLLVSRFRSAQVLIVGPDGGVQRLQPAIVTSPVQMEPAVAWRMVPLPGGGVALAHQRATTATVPTVPGGYGSVQMCMGAGLMSTAVTVIDSHGTVSTSPVLTEAVLPVDVAISHDWTELTLVAAGNATPGASFQVLGGAIKDLASNSAPQCASATPVVGAPKQGVVAVAYDGTDRVIVQTREPPTLQIFPDGTVIGLQGDTITNAGHDLFHAATPAFIACASCHPEGGDDGRVWNFTPIGPRRTKAVHGGLLGTEPFHWGGDMKDFPTLAQNVFTGRMSGGPLSQDQIDAMATWLDVQRLPSLAPPSDSAAVARGNALFHDNTVGCVNCHSGTRFTNQQLVDVGTGGTFKVPSLHGVAWRAPYLHDGRAVTLRDRFGPNGGADQHGHTSQLSLDQIGDLVAYLQTL